MGESIDTTSEVFTIADLSTVWAELAISQDVIPSVQQGYAATVYLPDGHKAEAEIGFVSPIVAQETRTALARVTLENPTGRFRPGTFVEAGIHVPATEEAVVIPKESVQLVHDHPTVFVWGSSAFELREVVTGKSDGKQIEILKGLSAGEAIASVNAFHLKAEYIKSSAGDIGVHSGCSH